MIPLKGLMGFDKFVAHKLGFFEHRNSYYFMTKEGPLKVSNLNPPFVSYLFKN